MTRTHSQNLIFLLFLAASSPTWADHHAKELEELKQLGLEGLLDLEITSVAKKAQKLWGSAAAIHVIEQEDIRRSGATSLPDLLRTVPGVQVVNMNANSWAITIRGFNGRFSNKLLVLMDGRSLYTPLYSGVYWDSQDTPLSDIERIEVIRGPGATVWGANAVNGVINIITRSSVDTQGNQLLARVGTEERQSATFRHGGTLNQDTHYRIYAKGFRRDGGVDSMGRDTHDHWRGEQVGFRVDSEITPIDSLRFQGDLYRGDSAQTISLTSGNRDDEADRSGGNLMLSWERILGVESGSRLQLYYDHTQREDGVTDELRGTWDVDFNHFFRAADNHLINWGLGYRQTQDKLNNVANSAVSVQPTERTAKTWSGFVQDQVSLITDTLDMTLGAKIEHNDYTATEIQPSARVAWTPDSHLTLWGSITGAVRTPSRIESDFTLTIPRPGTGFALLGNTNLYAERVTAYELGLRTRVQPGMTLDAALFYNRYKDLRSIEFQAVAPAVTPPYGLPPSSPLWVVNQLENGMYGDSYGLELSADWQINPNWRIKTGYSWLEFDLALQPWSSDTRSLAIGGYSPEHQFTLQSQWDLPNNLEFDLSLHHTSALESLDVDAYTRLDLRLGWRPNQQVETSLVVQNLLDDRHPEFALDEGIVAGEVERAIYAQIRWNF